MASYFILTLACRIASQASRIPATRTTATGPQHDAVVYVCLAALFAGFAATVALGLLGVI